MEAKVVIQRFGGQTALAGMIGKGQSTVTYWARSGSIRSKWHAELLRIAETHGVNLSASDLIADPKHPNVIEARVEPARTPEAKWYGQIPIGEMEVPCYVLDDGRRVISRGGATHVLTDGKGGGNLENYLNVEPLRPYLSDKITGQMIEFTMEGVVNRVVKGIEAETFLEICRAYVKALADNSLKTPRQMEIATKASMFLAACAKVGLIALIDEAAGYQYERGQEALRFKLKVVLEEEMRKWEKTFPDELWVEFDRLTNWKGAVAQRPKYWGKLVMELVYEYLDKDVAQWLKENAPKPRGGQNYHQWLSSQYGLKRLVEHLWMLIGMARACRTMRELRERMAAQFGRHPLQLTPFVPDAPVPQRRIESGPPPRGNGRIPGE